MQMVNASVSLIKLVSPGKRAALWFLQLMRNLVYIKTLKWERSLDPGHTAGSRITVELVLVTRWRETTTVDRYWDINMMHTKPSPRLTIFTLRLRVVLARLPSRRPSPRNTFLGIIPRVTLLMGVPRDLLTLFIIRGQHLLDTIQALQLPITTVDPQPPR